MNINNNKIYSTPKYKINFKAIKLNEKEFEAKLNDELGKIQSVNTKMIKLDWQDEIALANMDALKEELVNMVRKKRESGKDSFELTPEKANKLHDDRAYTACMASFALMCERRKSITQRKRNQSYDITKMVGVSKKPQKWGFYNN